MKVHRSTENWLNGVVHQMVSCLAVGYSQWTHEKSQMSQILADSLRAKLRVGEIEWQGVPYRTVTDGFTVFSKCRDWAVVSSEKHGRWLLETAEEIADTLGFEPSSHSLQVNQVANIMQRAIKFGLRIERSKSPSAPDLFVLTDGHYLYCMAKFDKEEEPS